MESMRQQTQTLPTKQILQESIYSNLRADGELDMRFRSSKQDLSVVQQEVVELKSILSSLLKGGFRIRNKCTDTNFTLLTMSGSPHPTFAGHQSVATPNSTWFLEPV
jgi:hypothetical protein